MQINNKRIIVTGAAGGIGKVLAEELAAKGARLCLLVRQRDDANTEVDLSGSSQQFSLSCDVTRAEQRARVLHTVERLWNGVDILINLAGVLDFRPFGDMDQGALHNMIQVNVEAPMQLARAVLPGMLEQGSGRIVNVGSMFGSIGFPYFAAYSATKFAMRGYSQALRRELAGSGVGVSYVSPRAVRTAMNPPGVHEMAERGMMRMDEPERVAKAIVRAIEKDQNECYIGFPESLFARINALLPGVVDAALNRQAASLSAFTSSDQTSKAVKCG